jgi:N-ethylmaleimide reductase
LQDTVAYYRARYRGTMIANGAFDRDTANAAISSKAADLVSFATPFIGNPDLVHRMRDALPISPSDPQTYYQGNACGYVDYPAIERGNS